MPRQHATPTIDAFKLCRRDLLAGASALGIGSLITGAPLGAAGPGASARAALFQGRWPVRPLLQADLSAALDTKVRAKPVQAQLVIDDMESAAGWQASPVVKLEYTTERARTGTRSLRFSTLLRNDEYIRAARAPNGSFTGSGVLFEGQPFAAFAHLDFATPQDWSAYNRISLWCYVHPTDNPINTLSIQFICAGSSAGPLDPVSVHYIGDLKSGEWNHLTWEIPEYRRDKVVSFAIFQTLSGVSRAHADPRITYDFDALTVDRVDAEAVQGWDIAAGKIAYSHIGYQPTAEKIAVAPDGPETFDLIDQMTGRTVGTYSARMVVSPKGTYRLLDFSAFTGKGRFTLRHGPAQTAAFPIGEDVWDSVTEATLNAFYGLRCGFPLPGVHDACHGDVFVEYGGHKHTVSGGWHDAANMTQGPYRTHLSIYALVELHDALIARGNAALAERAMEEALWGIDWSLRMRFGPGLRTLYMDTSYWTDGIVGTDDDVVQSDGRSKVGRDDYQNTLSVLAGARAARALRLRDPALAQKLLAAAREDFATVAPTIQPPAEAPPREINEPSWRDQIAYLTLAAAELHRTTGDAHYAGEAARLARWLIGTQERSFVEGIPIAGYFYEDAARTRIVHEYHNSFEDSALLAFAALCQTQPDHPDWMEWYAGLSIYAEHFCAAGSKASAPFNIIPAAVWRQADLDAPQPLDRTGERIAAHPSPVFPTPPTPALIRRQMQHEYDAGTRLGPNHCLRIFPLWYDHVRKGSSTVHMSKTIGLGAAAAIMNRPDLSDLDGRQVQWVLGANPFSRSLLYGVGQDYWQNFTVAMPNFVGGMSLGFNSYAQDAPAWGNNAVFPYKEMWVYSSCRMALNLSRVGMGAELSGMAPAGASFRHRGSEVAYSVRPGRYRQHLPAGFYDVTFGGETRSLPLADGATLRLDLDPGATVSFSARVVSCADGVARIALTAKGRGQHTLRLRGWNAHVAKALHSLDLAQGPVDIALEIAIADQAKPWLLHMLTPGGGDVLELGGTATQATITGSLLRDA